MAEIRINATGGVKLYDADDSHYAQIVAGTITSNTDVMTLGHAAVVMGTKLDMNGSNLVLDADADTYLDTGTDDTIKFYVSGAHDLTISANAINVLSGTTLTIDSGATIANSGTATGFSSADPASADGDSLGTASLEWSDLFLADGGIIKFGNDQDTLLTHTDGTGLTLNSTNKLTFGDAASFIQQSSDGVLRIDGEATVDINASAAVTIAGSTVPVNVGGIPFYCDFSNNSLYTHDVSGTDSTAANNTAYGIGALDAVTTGDYNVAIGTGALGAVDTGATNVFIGVYAGDGFDSETFNVGMGFDALGGAVAGAEYCTAIGHYTLDAVTSGDNNTAAGFGAGGGATTGANNVYIGKNAGASHTTGSQCVFIGSTVDPNAVDTSDQIVIGYSTNGVADSNFSFGSGNTNRVYNDFSSNASWTRSSDERLKKEIETNEDCGLDFINDLRTVTFKWRAPSEYDESVPTRDENETEPKHKDKMYGFIAQEVKSSLDKFNIKDFNGWNEALDTKIQGISYELFVMPLVKAVQELSAEVKELKEKLEDK